MSLHPLFRTTALAAALLVGCQPATPTGDEGTIPFEPQRPPLHSGKDVAPYTGSDALVLEAQGTYRNGLDFQRKFIMRTCGPTNGVCHNQKEYPDMHTPAAFAATLGAPCNVQPGSWNAVFDRCEQLGDRFRFVDNAFRELEIGWIDYIPGSPEGSPTRDSPGLHIQLQAPLPLSEARLQDTGVFIRTFINAGNVEDLVFTSFTTRWTVIDDKHLLGEVAPGQIEAVEQLLKVGIVQGDHNRNGVFGKRAGRTVSMLNPGKPEESYLVARIRGHMQGEAIPGSRMPLANQPPSVPDMLALMCFIQGANPSEAGWNLDWPIDYANCSYSADPRSLNLLGQGLTWRGRVLPILQANCGGCHGGTNPQAGFNVQDANLYQRLFMASAQKPTLNLVQAGDLSKSYLWHKLDGASTISGSRMPIDPNGGSGQLSASELEDISNWILFGAPQDG
jgi:hypothetical protein